MPSGKRLIPPTSLDRTLVALADPCRRRVVDLLRYGSLCAGDLADAVGLSGPAMSRHLRTLRDAGIIGETHPPGDARVRLYSLRPGSMAEIRSWLDETERLWTAQFDPAAETPDAG